jgi:hypothetical protein
LPLPPGFDLTGGEAAIDQAINETVGIAFGRLTMTFPSRDAYRELWRAHPSFAAWPAGADEYVDYDLVGVEPELRPACRMEAAARDARDIYALPGVVPNALPRPAVFLRAERGMFDEPDRPLYADGYARSWLPGTLESTVDGVNHYTITLGEHGAARVIAACR